MIFNTGMLTMMAFSCCYEVQSVTYHKKSVNLLT